MSKQGQLANCDAIGVTIKWLLYAKNALFIVSVPKIPPSLVFLL